MAGSVGTVTAALNDAPLSQFHLRTARVAGVGFFTDAYDLFVIGIALQLIGPGWHLTVEQTSGLAAASLLAACAGAVAFGRLADRFGRTRVYGLEAVLMALGALASALAPGFGWLLAARILLGVGVGGDYPISAVLMTEYANRDNRGRLVGLVFATQAIGVIVGPVLAVILLTAGVHPVATARVLLGVGAVPAAAVIYLRRKTPESPRFVARVLDRPATAASSLSELTAGQITVEAAMTEPPRHMSLAAFLRSRRYLITLMATGGSWFLLDYAYYGNTISAPLVMRMIAPHADVATRLLWTVGLFALFAVPGYLLAVWFMDRIGHRRLQIFGFLAMASSFIVMAAFPELAAITWAFLLLFGASYLFTEFGPNTTTFVLAAELYPVSMRATGHGLSAAIAKFGAFLGVFAFPWLTVTVGLRGSLMASAAASVLGALVSRLVPEPAGRTLEEVSGEDDPAVLLAESARLLALEREERERAEVLARAASALGARLEEDAVLRTLVEHARVASGSDLALLLHVDPSTGLVVRVLASGRAEEIDPFSVEGQPLSVLDLPVSGETHVLLPVSHRTDGGTFLARLGYPARSCLVMPVHVRGDLHAVLVCLDRRARRYGPREQALAEALIRQAAAAVDNALLHRQAVQAETRYRTLVEQIPAVLYVDAPSSEWRATYVSPQISALLGLNAADYLADPQRRRHLVHPDDLPRLVTERDRLLAHGGSFAMEYRMTTTDGKQIWVRDDAVVLAGPDGRPHAIQGVLSDITSRKTAEEQVRYLAYHDPLTGLANRAGFARKLADALDRAAVHPAEITVVYVDLDRFKVVNDGLGHAAGDDLLVQVAGRLRACVREHDTLARHGGDEFLLLLPGAACDAAPGSSISAPATVARIQASLSDPFDVAGTRLAVSASIGVSCYPRDARSADALIAHADAAMYEAKRNRSDTLHVARPEAAARRDLSLSARLHDAAKRAEWELAYQPVVTLLDRLIVGAEALIRWRDPDRGLVAPGEWLDLAEDLGLMPAILDWTLDRVVADLHEWQRQSLRPQIALNLSPRQLHQADLVDRLTRRIHTAALSPADLVIEVTESAVVGDPGECMLVLGRLHANGFRLAIDDFGTGHSSLSRLRHLPANVLKIDRSFVTDIADRRARSMVRAIVELADSLSMTAHAEGVETESQHRYLLETGCRLGQGYLYGRPVPAGELTDLLTRQGGSPTVESGGRPAA